MVEKSVIITGSNRGLGMVLVEEYAKLNYKIFACARIQSQEFEDNLKEISCKTGAHIIPVYFDLTDTDGIKSGIKQIFDEKCDIDVLINNAGVNFYGLIQMTSVDKAKDIFDVNFFAPLQISQLVLKKMLRQKKGVIINIASTAGLEANQGDGLYGASKAALISLTRTLATEVGGQGVRVNAVAPGPINSEMVQVYVDKVGDKIYDKMVTKRFAERKEVVDAVLFLSSDSASYINGQILSVDGGRI